MNRWFYEAELAEGAGFITEMAGNANEALQALEGPSNFDILLTDISHAGFDGRHGTGRDSQGPDRLLVR